MRIYTRRGDGGETGIFGGARITKTDARIEANGTLDELNSIIGIVRSLDANSNRDDTLREIQVNLLVLMSIVATPSELRESNPRRLPDGAVDSLERVLDEITAKGCMTQDFVLPGGCQVSAFLHQARTVCRRAERRLWLLNSEDRVDGDVLRYVNRLSDLLFALAREANFDSGTPDERWRPFCRQM